MSPLPLGVGNGSAASALKLSRARPGRTSPRRTKSACQGSAAADGLVTGSSRATGCCRSTMRIDSPALTRESISLR